MFYLDNLLILINKIHSRGLAWAIDRTKNEIRSPSNKFSRVISSCNEFIQVIIRKFTSHNFEKLEECNNQLIVVYDLNSCPITFDFAYFLASAESYATNIGKEKLFVYIILKDKKNYSFDIYSNTVDDFSKNWRLNNIIIPIINVHPRCVGYSVMQDTKSIKSFISNNFVFPEGYSETFKPMLDYSKIFRSLQSSKFQGLSASLQSLRYIERWRKNKNICMPIICITLRQYGYDSVRNSNIDAWVQFADWVVGKGYIPVFVPDTDACWETDVRLNRHHVFNEACWNLELRIALYEISYVNFFYSNGCSALATLNKKIPYIVMIPVLENSLQATNKTHETYGWTSEQRRLNFAENCQLLSFKIDTFVNICEEFYEFIKINQ